MLLCQSLVSGLHCPQFCLQLLCVLLVAYDLLFLLLHLLVKCTEPGLELVLVVVSCQLQRLKLIGEQGDFVVLLFKHVQVALVFLLQLGDLLVFMLDFSLEELNFLLENGPLFLHLHLGHLQVHLLLLQFLLEFVRRQLVLFL